MKKYKNALTILLIFMCILLAFTVYSVISNIRAVINYKDMMQEFPNATAVISRQLAMYATIIIFNCAIIGLSIFGIVILSKILKDKSLFHPTQPSPTVTEGQDNLM